MQVAQKNAYINNIAKGFISILGLFFVLGLLSGCENKKTKPPKASKGLIDLRKWDFEEKGLVDLNGQWEFYWEKFVRPTQLSLPEFKKLKTYIQQPIFWNDAPDSLQIRGTGYASYRLRILLSPDVNDISLKINPINTSHFLYANGRIVSRGGGVGVTKLDAWPEVNTEIIHVAELHGELDLVLWVSNYSHSRGGAWRPFQLGRSQDVLKTQVFNVGLEMFMIGSILIMSLYHLGLYFVQRKDESVLYFGLFCMAVFIRIITSGEEVLLLIWPGMSWEWLMKFMYLSFYTSLPLFSMFFLKMFPDSFSKTYVNFLFSVSGILILFVLLVSSYYYTFTAGFFELFALFACLRFIIVLIKQVSRRNKLAFPFLAGFFVLTLSVINDMLFQRGFIYTGNMVPLGLLTFIFSQSFLLSIKFSRAFHDVEDLGAELDFVIREQDNIINARTRELTAKKHSLEEAAALLQDTLDELEKTNVQLEYQTAAMNEAAGVVMLDRHGAIFYINQTFSRVSGFLSGEIIGERYRFLRSNRHDEVFFDQIKDALMNKHLNWHGEMCLRNKSGEEYWQDITLVPFLDLEGDPYQFLAICFDITDRKTTELEVLQKNEELEAHNLRIADINKKITASIHYATRIQRAVLPKTDLLSKWFSQHVLHFKPRDLVSGDFYFISQVENCLFIAVADSTGHGVPGGFMSMLGSAFLNELIVYRRILEPADILTQLRELVIQALNQGEKGMTSDGMDMSLCRICLTHHELCFASAHHALNIVRQGSVLEFTGDRQPIGLYPVKRPFTQQVIKLENEDWLYLYTDGYFDQLGSQLRRKYSKKRFRELLDDMHYFPANKQLKMLEDEHNWWRQQSGQTDDILVLGLQVDFQKLGVTQT